MSKTDAARLRLALYEAVDKVINKHSEAIGWGDSYIEPEISERIADVGMLMVELSLASCDYAAGEAIG